MGLWRNWQTRGISTPLLLRVRVRIPAGSSTFREPGQAMTKQGNMKLLHDRRNQLQSELAAAQARLQEVESLIRAMSGEAMPEPSTATAGRVRRGDLNNIVLSLYEQAAEAGLSTSECVGMASKAGTPLKATSVSSLLSRLKADGILMYDGERYRLKRFAGPRSAAV